MADRALGVERSLTPVVATIILTLLVVALAATVVLGVGSIDGPDRGPTAAIELSADATDNEIRRDHVGGDPIDVEAVDLTIRIEDEPLELQPTVPFFQIDGFLPGPTGPFNEQSPSTWREGESTSFKIADTNDPLIEPGDRVSVTIEVDGSLVASLETRAST